MSAFGEKLKCLREERGETQDDIAKLLKISRTSISKYESGDREPDIETIKILSKHFGVSVDYIFGLSDSADSLSYIQEVDFKAFIEDDTESVNIYYNLSYEEIQEIIRNEQFIRLVKKIKENNLDIKLIEKLVDNIFMSNNG